MKLFNGRVSKPECGCVHVTSKRIEELEDENADLKTTIASHFDAVDFAAKKWAGRVAELEKQELGFIQSLRELDAQVEEQAERIEALQDMLRRVRKHVPSNNRQFIDLLLEVKGEN